jgi:hypothetical protein
MAHPRVLAILLLTLPLGPACAPGDDPAEPDLGGATPDTGSASVAPDSGSPTLPTPPPSLTDAAPPPGKDAGFGARCGPATTCAAGLLCVQFNESGSGDGYCTAECSGSVPCPASPAGAECAFQLSSGKLVCGFLCSNLSPVCPPGLTCTLANEGQYTYCSTDPAAVCGNGKRELLEQCDGSDLDGASCLSFGYSGGKLACSPSCALDKSACSGQNLCAGLPPRDCSSGTAACAKLVLFSPTQGPGYVVTHGQSYSYAREDVVMLVKYAAAAVACLMPGSYPIATGDMSMSDGSTPKSSSGGLRHPQGTHDGGRDIDLAYFQTGQPNNNLRPVCEHTLNGQDQYHCVAPPTILDLPRTALFIGKLLESERVRVLGVDGQIGPLLAGEAQKLQAQGLLSSSVVKAFTSKVAYETTNSGKGWFQFHHHHLHLSTWTTQYSSPIQPGSTGLPSSWPPPIVYPAP